MPELLYHYTNQVGLLGILNSRSLWATRIHYLNDSQEFWQAFNVADDELNRRVQRTTESKEREKLEALRDEMESLLAVGTVVCSLSERADSLSQWRSYVGNQPGFALGFDFSDLQTLAERAGFELHRCIYDPKEQQRKIATLIDAVMATDFNTSPGYEDPERPRTIVILKRGGDYMDKLQVTAPLIKHQAFEDEREWRLVSWKLKTVTSKYRPGPSMITPYVEFDLTKDGKVSCLREIVVGPTPHKELAERAVRELAHGMTHLEPKPRIVLSNAPFRYW